jgi:transcriptional regulator with XRE-family HTH domain
MIPTFDEWLDQNRLSRNDLLLPIGKGIRENRLAVGCKQERLAQKLDISQASISRIENGAAEALSVNIFYSIVEFFKCPLSKVALTTDWLTREEHDRIADQILAVVNVQTIFGKGDSADIRDLYYPTRLIDAATGSSRAINTLSELEPAVLVHGSAGQGKSFLLRYLTANSFAPGKPLPLFFQLSGYQGIPIELLVLDRLNELDFQHSAVHIEFLMATGGISLVFDAFDEIETVYRTKFLDQLKSLIGKFKRLQVLISARPQAGRLNEHLKVYSIEPIEASSLPEVIACYATENEAHQLIKQLSDNKDSITGVLTTPLMVALLVIHFRYKSTVPDHTIMFYKDLFDVLVRRHNKTDDGNIRHPITCGLKKDQLQAVFEMISFLVEQDFPHGGIHISDLEKIALRAIQLSNVTASADQVLDDIIHITNLLIEDQRGVFTYVHKTIREYYAAACICSPLRGAAQPFYERALDDWHRWSGVLEFLEIVDPFRFQKYFRLVDLERIMPFTAETVVAQFQVISLQGIFNTGQREATEYLVCLSESIRHCTRQEADFIFTVTRDSLTSFLAANSIGPFPYYYLEELILYQYEKKWSALSLAHLIESGFGLCTIDDCLNNLKIEYETLCSRLNTRDQWDSVFQM